MNLESRPDDPVIDPEILEGLRELSGPEDDSFLRRLLAQFARSHRQLHAELTQAVAGADRAAATRATHSIQGSAANVGARRLAAAATALHEIVEQERWEQATEGLARMGDEGGAALAALEEICPGCTES